ncbi:MAG TPA: ATP-dependent metallopeptidase FtsH/Yme1/Tma family protein, partial [Thermoanaerobaculia bacterium]
MAIFVVVILLWNTFQHSKANRQELNFTQFMEDVEKGKVAEVTIRGQQLSGKFKGGAEYPDGEEFTAQLPNYPDLVKDLQKSDVVIKAEEPRDNPLIAVLFTWAPLLLIVVLWIFFMRQMQTGGNKALSFGKSKAKLLNTSGKK